MSVPATFAAAYTPAPSAPSSPTTLTTTQSFTVPLSTGDITVRITATAINPVDWKFRDQSSLTPYIPIWPTILGSDAAGEVVQVGADFADKFSVGDRVWFQGIYGKPETCTFQQYCRVPAHLVGKVPSKQAEWGFTDDEAASLSLGSITATVGIYHSTGRGVVPAPWSEGGSHAGKGKAVVILGGSTSVGQYAVQLARLSGYDRIVVSAGPKHEGMLKALGASVVVGRHSWAGGEDGNVQEFVDAIGDDLELDWVYDCVTLDRAQEFGVRVVQAAQKVADGVMVVSANQVEDSAIAASKAGTKKREVRVQGIFALGYHPDYRYVTEPMYANISKWLVSGEFVPNKVQIVPGGLKALNEAMDLNKNGVSGVKVIVRPHEGL